MVTFKSDIHFHGVPCPACGGTVRYARRQNVCINCANIRKKKWRALNPDKVKVHVARSVAKRKAKV